MDLVNVQIAVLPETLTSDQVRPPEEYSLDVSPGLYFTIFFTIYQFFFFIFLQIRKSRFSNEQTCCTTLRDTLASRQVRPPVEYVYREKQERKNDSASTIDFRYGVVSRSSSVSSSDRQPSRRLRQRRRRTPGNT